ncbi:MAG: DUF6134 family protein [Alphaproteobacteria bacterium]
MMDRRTCLRLIAGAAAGVATNPAWAHPAAPARDLRFRLLRDGSSIGTYAVAFRKDHGKTIAVVDVDIVVRVAFINAFKYHHHSEETFEGSRLTAVSSTTNDNGKSYGVKGRATPDGFRLEGPSGPFTAPTNLLTSNSAWNADFVRQQALINAQQGGQCGLAANRIGTESVMVRGVPVEATKYRAITPQCAGHVWYAADGRWVRAVLEMRGETVEYVLI